MANLARSTLALSTIALSLLPTGIAGADPDPVVGYTGQHGGEVCAFMQTQPDMAGVRRAIDHILATSDLPEDQTGRLLATSVGAYCPEDAALVEKFLFYVRHRQQQGNSLGILVGS